MLTVHGWLRSVQAVPLSPASGIVSQLPVAPLHCAEWQAGAGVPLQVLKMPPMQKPFEQVEPV
ncbi:hypothetical protein D3C83_303850 [compost metagenome]